MFLHSSKCISEHVRLHLSERSVSAASAGAEWISLNQEQLAALVSLQLNVFSVEFLFIYLFFVAFVFSFFPTIIKKNVPSLEATWLG